MVSKPSQPSRYSIHHGPVVACKGFSKEIRKGTQGRRSLHLTTHGYRMTTDVPLEWISQSEETSGLARKASSLCHDIRLKMPGDKNQGEGSHMCHECEILHKHCVQARVSGIDTVQLVILIEGGQEETILALHEGL